MESGALGETVKGGVWVTAVNEREFDAFLYQERSVSFSQEDSNSITNMAWDPTGRWVLVRSADGMVGVIDREAVQVLASLQGPVEGVSGLSWPREEEAFVTVAGEEGPGVWQLNIPSQVLTNALDKIEQGKAAAAKEQEEARLRVQNQTGAVNKRIAFVVGINRYDNFDSGSQLQYPVNDAKAVSLELRKIGFEVFEGINLTESEFYEKWQLVLDQISSQDIFIFFFSGHGVQIEGENFLLPGDVPYFEYGRSKQFKRRSINVPELFADLKIGAQQPPKMTIMILDASRHDPTIPPEFRLSDLKQKGRKNVELDSLPGLPGTFILYSAAPGQVSLDRLGPNDPSPHSVFIRKLLPLIGQPGLSIQDLAVRVKNEVYEETANFGLEQIPSYSDRMLGMYCLAGCQPGTLDTKKRPKEPRTITGKDGAPMVLVPAGEFTMGAAADDKDALDRERPAHAVYLDAYYIDQYEVTTSRYATFFQEKKRDPPRYWSETVLTQHGQKPVVGVTWEDANAYCEWAGKRLPTDAEWEKAARGTDGRVYPWGNETPTKQLANFNQGFEFKDYEALADVGSFNGGKSPYGAYDMAGNVWEWVADWYDANLYQQRAKGNKPVKNPAGPEKGELKVLRGGSWGDFNPRFLRSTDRGWSDPTNRNYFGGFRCARDAR